MSKKASKDSSSAPLTANDDGSPQGTAVDFIFQTMIARASAPGKRQIRPKNVDALLHADIQEFGSDEDPDFDVKKDKHHNESDVSIESDADNESDNVRGDDDDDKGSMDGNVEDSDDEDDVSYDADKDPHLNNTSDEDSDNDDSDNSSSDTSEDDTDSQSPVQKRSALRETLQKLKESEFAPQQNRKRKRPRKAGVTASSSNKSRGVKKDEANSTNKKSQQKSKVKKDPSGGAKKTIKRGSATNTKKRLSVESDRTKNKDRLKAKKKKRSSGLPHRSITDMVMSVEKSQKENRKEIIVGSPICSACLGKASDEMNEIVECDSCGITVHEGCYGVSDTLSVSSGTGSSCSTEPWFCDACRTGATSISCELCPMQGGLYKETTAGRWVHLVCALYTPGVVITDSGLPSLFEIPYPKWGAQQCSLCDNVRFSRSGICIPCDAGMCKTYLHATCAQKHGLLSDPIPQTSTVLEEVDPFFAACKLHTNRETSKRRAKCFAVLQEQLRIKQQQKLSTNISEQERLSQSRIRRKLERIRFKVAIKQAHSYSSKYSPAPLTANNLNAMSSNLLPPLPTMSETLPGGWKNGNNKKARLLPTSAGTARAFLRKAVLMGLDVKALELEDKHSRIVASVKKKWNVPAGLSVEYSAYYADRENRITGLTQQCEQLEAQNSQLNNHQIDLQNSYDRQFVHNQLMDEDTSELHVKLIGITSVLKSLCSSSNNGDNKKLIASIEGIETKTEIRSVSGRRRSPSHSKGRQSPFKGLASKKVKRNISFVSGAIPSSSERLAIKTCSICDESDEQPWIICCDNCKKHYHLKCLDPPLTRLPKRSRLCGWMCSDCGEEELEAEEATEVDPEAPRSLRGRTKIRKPGKYRHSTDSKEADLKPGQPIGKPCEPITEDPVLTSPNVNIKMKLDLSSPNVALANGTFKSPKRKRKSGSSIVSNTNSISIPQTVTINLSDPTVGPTAKKPKPPRKPKGKRGSMDKENPVNPGNAELAAAVAVITNNSNSLKLKKPRVRKPKAVKIEGQDGAGMIVQMDPVGQGMNSIVAGSATGDLGAGTVSTGSITKKRRNLLNIKTKIIKAKKVSSSVKVPRPRPPKTPKIEPASPKPRKYKKKSINDVTTTLPAETLFASPAAPKRKRIKKSATGPSGSEQSDQPTNLPHSTTTTPRPVKKPRKPKKSLAELQKIMMAAATVAVKKGDEPNPVVLTNGKFKLTKRRKSSLLSDTGDMSSVGNLGKEKSIPPKKRKRVVSLLTTPLTEKSHQDDVINAVASGIFDDNSMAVVDDMQLNGISRPSLPDGVLMQGVAPVKSGWHNNTDGMMKGPTDSDVVTVNASDLIDCVLHAPPSATTTTTAVSSYSPGFYSSSAPSTSSNVALTSTSITKDAVSSTSNLISKPTSTTTSNGESVPNAQTWGQNSQPQNQESQNQNVIKLIYESPDSATTTPTSSSPRGAAANNVQPQSSGAPTATSMQPFAGGSFSSDNCGTCFSCNKQELKKNMVTCDKCAQDFHFLCLTPPLMYSPRRRNYAWYCSTCDEVSDGQAANQTNKQLETPHLLSEHPTMPTQQQSRDSRLTVHLFDDEIMKNYMRKFQ